MISERAIKFLFLLTFIMMIAGTAVPHHHHHDQSICFKTNTCCSFDYEHNGEADHNNEQSNSCNLCHPEILYNLSYHHEDNPIIDNSQDFEKNHSIKQAVNLSLETASLIILCSKRKHPLFNSYSHTSAILRAPPLSA